MNYRVVRDFSKHIKTPQVNLDQQISSGDSILLIRLSAIGDTVRALPLVQYLRNNGFDGRLGWATQPLVADLIDCWDGVDRVHPVHRKHLPWHPVRYYREASELNSFDYDWVFDLHGLLKSGLVSRATGAPRRIGFSPNNSKEFNHWFQTHTVSRLADDLPRILKYIQLIRPFIDEKTFQRKKTRPTDPQFDFNNERIESIASETPIIIHPSTSHDRYGQSKEWGIDNYRELLEEMLPYLDHPVRITWGPGERDTAQAIADSFDDSIRISPETNTLIEFGYLIRHARMVISGDTAPCHMADVMGTPLVVLFGSSNHYVSGPLLTNYRLLTCRNEEQQTADIPVNRVFQAVIDLLQEIE